MSSSQVGALLALVFVTARLALAIRVTCEDGGKAMIAGFGRRFVSGSVCDIDRSCDGICTFALNVPCMRCWLGRGCRSPDTESPMSAQVGRRPTRGRQEVDDLYPLKRRLP
jgi:hypothetical protein